MKAFCFILSVLLPLAVFSQQNPVDCSAFKNGTFTYLNDSSQVVDVERKGRYQTERNRQTGEVQKFVVKWSSPCEYQLKQFATNRKASKKNNGRILKIQIIKLYGDRYDYACLCPTAASVTNFFGTMIKVK